MPHNRCIAISLELTSPYKRHAEMFAGTQRYAQEQGWDSKIDEYAYDTLATGGSNSLPFDGVIARANGPLAEQSQRRKIPLVNVWHSSPVKANLPGVFADVAAAGRLSAKHLLSRGFRNFATLGSHGDQAVEEQRKEFERIIAEAGFACKSARIGLNYAESLTAWRKAERTLDAWLDQWQLPIAVLAGAEHAGRKVVDMCQERGWRIPNDVAIIAGWNEPTYCLNPRPTLSSMEIGYERIGYEAAKLLHRLMRTKSRSKRTSSSEHVILPPQGLVLRESTDSCSVKDGTVKAALDFIAVRSHEPISPDDVAAASGVSSRTLQRRFREILGSTMIQEIRRVRIERAKRELTQSDATMAQIARKVGFGPTDRMYDAFLNDVGVPPTEYRRQRRIRLDT